MSAQDMKRISLMSMALLAMLSGVACQKSDNKKVNLAFGIVPKDAKKSGGPAAPTVAKAPVVVAKPPVKTPAPPVKPEQEDIQGGVGSSIEDGPVQDGPREDGQIVDNGTRSEEEYTKPNVEKRYTGGKTEDGLLYTGSAEDKLLPFLKQRADSAGGVSKNNNNALAKQIQDASIRLDEDGSVAIITIKLNGPSTNKKTQTLRFSAAVNPNASSEMKMSKEQSRQFPNVKATLHCVDLDGTCESSFVRFKNGSGIVAVILRNTESGLYANFPKNESDSYEYSKLSRYIWNSTGGLNVSDRFDRIVYESFEVVNGKSGFRATMIGRDAEVLSFAAPLVAPEVGTNVNASVDRTIPSFIDELIGLNDVQTDLANMITDTRLVNNNSQGRVSVSIKLRGSSPGRKDLFKFTFTRKVNPLMTLSSESLKLN